MVSRASRYAIIRPEYKLSLSLPLSNMEQPDTRLLTNTVHLVHSNAHMNTELYGYRKEVSSCINCETANMVPMKAFVLIQL